MRHTRQDRLSMAQNTTAASIARAKCIAEHAHTLGEAFAGLDDPAFLLGAAWAVAGAAVIQVGVALLRRWRRARAHSLPDASNASSLSALPWNDAFFKLWAAAAGMLSLGTTLLVWSFALLPASVALPIIGIGVALGAFLNTKLPILENSSVFSTHDYVGCALIVVGALLAAAVANKRDCPLTASELQVRLLAGTSTSSGTYVICVVAWVALLIVSQGIAAVCAAWSAWSWSKVTTMQLSDYPGALMDSTLPLSAPSTPTSTSRPALSLAIASSPLDLPSLSLSALPTSTDDKPLDVKTTAIEALPNDSASPEVSEAASNAAASWRRARALLFAIFALSWIAVSEIGVKGSADLFRCFAAGDACPLFASSTSNPSSASALTFTAIFLTLTAFVLMLQVRFLLRCASLFDQMILGPAVYISVCGCSVSSGTFIFREWIKVSLAQIALFSAGLILLFSGMICLTLDHLQSAYQALATQHDDDSAASVSLLQLHESGGNVSDETSLLRAKEKPIDVYEEELPDEFDDLFEEDIVAPDSSAPRRQSIGLKVMSAPSSATSAANAVRIKFNSASPPAQAPPQRSALPGFSLLKGPQ